MPSARTRKWHDVIVALVLISLCPGGIGSLFAQTSIEGVPPEGFGSLESAQGPCVPLDEYDYLPPGSNVGSLPLAPTNLLVLPDSIYSWPLSNALHDGVILVNYVDDDQSINIVRDYMGYPHAYDGHRGTDMTLFNFRSMDRGVPVLAAADGVVFATRDGNFDRNTETSSAPANLVLIDHGSGNLAYYLHLRRNSITVRPGESVRRGQMIGLTGSSGSSTDPHLHFEPSDNFSRRDPWNGPGNPLPSLWRQQEPYLGAEPLRIYDMGAFTNAAAGGSAAFFPFKLLKEKLSQPMSFGTNEPRLAIWLQLQGQYLDSYRLEVRRPDNSLFSSNYATLQNKLRYGWHYWYWPFAAGSIPPQSGTWKVTVNTGAGTAASLQFFVGEATVFAPRFSPAGRSFSLGQQNIQDILHVSPLGGPVTYSLQNAPGYVSLQDSIVMIHPPSTHRHRSLFFQALATDQLGRQDTMWYHLVDFEAPNRIEVPAHVFGRDGHRTIPDALSSSQTCFRIEAVYGSFANSNVDPSTIVMTSWDTGSVEEIGAVSMKSVAVGDTDWNGVAELPACFAREDLGRLFSDVGGRKGVKVEVGGDLVTGERFFGTIELRVVGTGSSPAASVSPNPLNPGGHLRFTSTKWGPITVRMFNLGGRLVRTLLNSESFPPGAHEIWIDGRGRDGENLASGVYYYRIDAADRVATGRFVIVK